MLARCGADTALAPTSTGAFGSCRDFTQSMKFRVRFQGDGRGLLLHRIGILRLGIGLVHPRNGSERRRGNTA